MTRQQAQEYLNKMFPDTFGLDTKAFAGILNDISGKTINHRGYDHSPCKYEFIREIENLTGYAIINI